MSAGFRQPAAHTHSVRNTSVLRILNKRQPNALLLLKRGRIAPPPPSLASGGQLQGKIYTVLVKRELYPKSWPILRELFKRQNLSSLGQCT